MNNFHIFRNPNFQLDKISPIENGSLVTFINNYMYAMVGLLNDFSNQIETKLIDLTHRIDNCYSNLVILEMKLNSLNTIQCDNFDNAQTPMPEQIPSTDVNVDSKQVFIDAEKSEITQSEELVNSNQSNESTNIENHSSPQRDENIETYKKMLKFGVHENAVRQKMLMDGIDPSLLNL